MRQVAHVIDTLWPCTPARMALAVAFNTSLAVSFPPEIISHCVWLYHRFPLSFRDVQELSG